MDSPDSTQGSLFGEPAPRRDAPEPTRPVEPPVEPAKPDDAPTSEAAAPPADVAPPVDAESPGKVETPDKVESPGDVASSGNLAPGADIPAPRTRPEASAARFGEAGLVGQPEARERIARILQSERLSHAYLLAGPKGSGKTAFALALAEWVNGVSNLSDLGPAARSGKRTWHAHPDIHVFQPIPTGTSESDRLTRLEHLANDPYALVDYANRPTIAPLPRDTGTAGGRDRAKAGGARRKGSASSGGAPGAASKNLKAFYSIQYFRELIRPVTVLSPNEGARTVVVMTGIETMRAETANAFLKLLEEPAGEVMFILTADSVDTLLPTILSRCQLIRLRPLQEEEVARALIERDAMDAADARFLAKVSDGNYALARFFQPEQLRERQDQLIEFLRKSYSLDPGALIPIIEEWNTKLNAESQVALLTQLELLLRDILVHRETGRGDWVVHTERMEVVSGFQTRLRDARLEQMIDEVGRLKPLLLQSVQFRLSMVVLATRFHRLMLGQETAIPSHAPWRHLPAMDA